MSSDNAEEGNVVMEDGNFMRHLRNDNEISWVCQFCGHPFPWEVLPQTFRHHLAAVCESVPEDVKEAAQIIEEEDEFSIVESNDSNFNPQTEDSMNAEAAECSRSVNREPRRILDAIENNDSNFEAETESNVVRRSNKRQRTAPDASENNDSNFEAETESNIVGRSNKRQRTAPDALPIVAALQVPMAEGVQDRGESSSVTKRLVGDAFERNEEKIWSLLMDDQVLRIGIYGMGGVGKTTLMRHIQTRLEGERSSQVYWITVSQDFSIWKLQNLIAKKIDLRFKDNEDEVDRAKKLTESLGARGNYVLILDDLWNYFDVDEVGIPVTCKLILTTRLLKICCQMGCSDENRIQVQALSEKEARILFTRELGNYSPKVEELAQAVCRECAGLPLGIKVMARSMKGIWDDHTWRSTLEELKESKVCKGHEMLEQVFSVLKFSYLQLKDPALQECLSYCALFPEDYRIRRDDLIEYMIIEGIIDAKKTRRAESDRGHTMLDALENACLLEGGITPGDSRFVCMHDLIRDMVILELREGSKTLVEAGAQLKELPDVEKWTENLVRVSLIRNDIEVIPPSHTPRCPNLSTLLLCENIRLKMIADPFFQQFQSLKILNLSSCNTIEELPRSISDLVNLTGLSLRGCYRLIHVPALAKLEKLKRLDLGFCKKVKQMPEGVEFLFKLKYLDLRDCGIEEIGSGIIPMLSRLQVLLICEEYGDIKFSIRGSEVRELRMLETLHCKFSDVEEFWEYMEFLKESEQSPTDCSTHWRESPTNCSTRWDEHSSYITYSRKLGSRKIMEISGYSLIDLLALPTDIEILKIYSCFSWSLFSPSLLASLSNLQEIHVSFLDDYTEEIFATMEEENGEGRGFPFSNYSTHSLPNHSLLNLEGIKISSCHNLKKLFPPNLLPNLHNLQEISVQNCDVIEEIFATMEGENGEGRGFPFSNYSTYSLPDHSLLNLKRIKISWCHKVKKLFPSSLLPNLHNLQAISVQNCDEMEEIFSTDQEEEEDEQELLCDRPNLTELHLPKLSRFELRNLPKLRSIYKGAIICRSLRKIELVRCPKLKRIPISLPQPSLQRIQVYPEEWWDSVQWGSADDKKHLNSIIVFKNIFGS